MKKPKIKNKKGIMELSIGTIVIIVLVMTMLVLALVFVKNISDKFNHNFTIYKEECKNESNRINEVAVKWCEVGCLNFAVLNINNTLDNVEISKQCRNECKEQIEFTEICNKIEVDEIGISFNNSMKRGYIKKDYEPITYEKVLRCQEICGWNNTKTYGIINSGIGCNCGISFIYKISKKDLTIEWLNKNCDVCNDYICINKNENTNISVIKFANENLKFYKCGDYLIKLR